MNTKNLLLGIFAVMTVVFASLTFSEYYNVNTLKSQLLSQSTSTQTLSYPSSRQLFFPNTTGSFTYTPTGQVQVISVIAIATANQNGWNVIFAVTFENIGSSPIRTIGGWIGALSSDTNSSILQKTPSPQCDNTVFLVTLNHGQNYTLYTPDCGFGFNYQLIGSGSANVRLSFNWNLRDSKNSNSTTISAKFTFVT